MTTYQIQLQHTPTQSAAGDWDAVAAILTADIVSPNTAKRSYNEVLAALGVSDMEHTLAAFSASELGRDGRQMLVTVGLSFAHPRTVALVHQLEAAHALRPGVALKLLALGTQTTQLAAGVTAEQCRIDWQVQLHRQRLEPLQERFDQIKNQIGTTEQAAAIVALRAMADAIEEAAQ